MSFLFWVFILFYFIFFGGGDENIKQIITEIHMKLHNEFNYYEDKVEPQQSLITSERDQIRLL